MDTWAIFLKDLVAAAISGGIVEPMERRGYLAIGRVRLYVHDRPIAVFIGKHMYHLFIPNSTN